MTAPTKRKKNKKKTNKQTNKHPARREMTSNDICSQSVSQQQADHCYVFYLLLFAFNLRVSLLYLRFLLFLRSFSFICVFFPFFVASVLLVWLFFTCRPYPKAQRILFHKGQIPTPKKKKDNSLSFIFFWLFFFISPTS